MHPEISDATPDAVSRLLKSGIAAARAKQPDKARTLLLQVLEHDQGNVSAWLWLSSVLANIEEQETCLQNVLTLDPENIVAQKGLSLLQRQKQGRTAPPVETTAPSPPLQSTGVSPEPAKPTGPKYKRLSPSSTQPRRPQPERTTKPKDTGWFEKPVHARRAASPASGMLFGQREIISQPVEDNSQHNDVFGNDYLCPYCAHQTRPEDKKCKACRGNLWFAVPRLKNPSKYFRYLYGMQFLNVLGFIILWATLVYGFYQGEPAPTGMLIYFAALTIASILILIGLRKRWRVIFYLVLFQATIFLGLLILTMFRCLFFLGVTQFFMALNLGDDFTFDKHRLLLRVDADVKTGPNLLDRGNFYAKKKMWALAAVHFRQAAYQLSNQLAPQLALAVAYNNLKMYDKMREPLARATALNPSDSGVQKLNQLMDKRHQ